jgi:hypothetical protein
MAGVPRGRACGGRLLNRFQGFMICFYCNRVSRRYFIRLTYHAYNFEKKEIKSYPVSLFVSRSPGPELTGLHICSAPLARPARLLGSLAVRLVRLARPPSDSSAWLARPARPLGSWHAVLLRTFQMINYLSLLYYSPWHLTHFLCDGSCATTLYPTYPTYPTPAPCYLHSIVAKFYCKIKNLLLYA